MSQQVITIKHPATGRVQLSRCENWDLSQYPDRDPRNNKPASDVFVLAYLNPEGDVDFKRFRWEEKDKKTRELVTFEKEVQPKITAITGGGTTKKKIGGLDKLKTHIPMVSQPEPHDLRSAEKAIEGKPSIVRMGLWHMPKFDSEGTIIEWLAVDRKKLNRPIHWIDVTDEYYGSWRPAAYKDLPDPFKGQHRPFTRLQELEQKNTELLAGKDAEIARLKADLEKRA